MEHTEPEGEQHLEAPSRERVHPAFQRGHNQGPEQGMEQFHLAVPAAGPFVLVVPLPAMGAPLTVLAKCGDGLAIVKAAYALLSRARVRFRLGALQGKVIVLPQVGNGIVELRLSHHDTAAGLCALASPPASFRQPVAGAQARRIGRTATNARRA